MRLKLIACRFPGYEEEVRKKAKDKGWEYEKLEGDMRLLRKLVDGEWDRNPSCSYLLDKL